MALEETLNERMGRFEAVKGLEIVQAAFRRAMASHQAFKSKAAEVGANKNLSPFGRTENLRTYVSDEAHQVVRAHKTLARIKAKQDERRASIQPKSPDKADVAGAVARSDLRNMLRGMKMGERANLLLAKDADPMLRAAVLELPNYASGIDDFIRGAVTNAVIEREHPGALAELEEADAAIEVLEVITQVFTGTAMRLAELPTHAALGDFVAKAVGDTARLDADIDRSLSEAA